MLKSSQININIKIGASCLIKKTEMKYIFFLQSKLLEGNKSS